MAVPNQLNPNFDRISFRMGSAVITGGVDGWNDATIKAEVGTLANNSIYISNYDTTCGIWIMQAGTWTRLTIN